MVFECMEFGELQPYRVWFDFLKTCLLDENLSKKIDRDYYKSWNLSEIKNSKFNKWFKTHSHLFTSKGSIKIVNKISNPQTIILEIPTNFKIKEIQREIPRILKGKVNKSTSRFILTHERKHIKTQALDGFLITWKFKQEYKNYSNEEIWDLTNEEVDKRQLKVKRLVDEGKLRKRKLQGIGQGKGGSRLNSKQTTSVNNKSIMISKSILRASKILLNVAKGKFPGEYSNN
jgi:hypothetical protein